MMRTVAIFLSFIVALLPMTAGQSVSISPASGAYDGFFNIMMQGPEGFSIHYTLNGSVPTADDAQYSSVFPPTFSHSNIFSIQNCPDVNWVPCDEVDRIVVVRAALFDSAGVRRSDVSTSSYVMNTLLGRRIELPVVSLCVDSVDLFDYDSGIFVPGQFYNEDEVYNSGNYCQRGREWERDANFCFMEDGEMRLEQDCGIRIHGARSRSFMQKGFTLYARKEYGDKYFRYPFFEGNGIDKYKRLVLRPWMASWSDAGVEDWICQQLANPLGCDNLATRPVVLFLNGEYWGVYFMEEKADEHYINEHYGFDDEDVDLLSDWGFSVDNGNADDWRGFYEWVQDADLSRQEDYQYFASKVDVDAFLDYMLLEVFVSNVDWPSNNVRQWSVLGSPWRWIFFDGDAALSDRRENSEILGYITCDDSSMTYPASPRSSLLFRKLLANEDFRHISVDRFSKLIFHYWNYASTAPLLEEISDKVSSEVEYQSARFSSPLSVSNWRGKIRNIDSYLKSRPVSMFDDYAKHIGVDLSKISVRLYPNPSHSVATLEYDSSWGGVADYSVYDVMGRCVVHQTSDLVVGTNLIQLPRLPQGVFFIKVNGVDYTLRWIVIDG